MGKVPVNCYMTDFEVMLPYDANIFLSGKKYILDLEN